MTQAAWVMHPISNKTPWRKLLELLSEVPPEFYRPPTFEPNRKQARDLLTAARAAYWGAQQTPEARAARRANARKPVVTAGITAAEANEMLAGFPEPTLEGSVHATLSDQA